MKKTISVFLAQENINKIFVDNYIEKFNNANISDTIQEIIDLAKRKTFNYAYIYRFLKNEKLRDEVSNLRISDIIQEVTDPNTGDFKGYIFTTPDFKFKESIITNSPIDTLSSEEWENKRKFQMEYTNWAISPMYGIRYNGGIPEVDNIDLTKNQIGRCMTMFDLMEVFDAFGMYYETTQNQKKQFLLERGFTVPINPFYYYFLQLIGALKNDVTIHGLEKFARPAFISF